MKTVIISIALILLAFVGVSQAETKCPILNCSCPPPIACNCSCPPVVEIKHCMIDVDDPERKCIYASPELDYMTDILDWQWRTIEKYEKYFRELNKIIDDLERKARRR